MFDDDDTETSTGYDPVQAALRARYDPPAPADFDWGSIPDDDGWQAIGYGADDDYDGPYAPCWGWMDDHPDADDDDLED